MGCTQKAGGHSDHHTMKELAGRSLARRGRQLVNCQLLSHPLDRDQAQQGPSHTFPSNTCNAP